MVSGYLYFLRYQKVLVYKLNFSPLEIIRDKNIIKNAMVSALQAIQILSSVKSCKMDTSNPASGVALSWVHTNITCELFIFRYRLAQSWHLLSVAQQFTTVYSHCTVYRTICGSRILLNGGGGCHLPTPDKVHGSSFCFPLSIPRGGRGFATI